MLVADVALLTEGTYPYHFGGVSVWCDQLVREIPDHTFRVVALVATGAEQVVWPLPDNVVSVDAVPMWGRPATGSRSGRSARTGFLPILAGLVDVLLDPSTSDQNRLRDLLGSLAEYGQRANLTACFTSEQAVWLLMDAWQERGHGGGADNRRGEARPPSAVPTLHDALTALQLLEHAVRPLCRVPVRADIVHATTNGLGVLPGLAAKWRYGTPMVVSEHGVYRCSENEDDHALERLEGHRRRYRSLDSPDAVERWCSLRCSGVRTPDGSCTELRYSVRLAHHGPYELPYRGKLPCCHGFNREDGDRSAKQGYPSSISPDPVDSQ